MYYKKDLSERVKDQLKPIKEKIQTSYVAFKENNDRFKDYMQFVFHTSLKPDTRNKLSILQKPAVEVNIVEAIISRLRGEFAKQEPTFNVMAAEGLPIAKLTPQLLQTIEAVENHLREILSDTYNDNLRYNLYTDGLAGGFSVAKVYTDYVNEMSFEQKIMVKRVFDPTLTYFDPLARESHKGDGRYCGELYPLERKEFIEYFGEDVANRIKYNRGLGNFQWTYKNQDIDVILVADHYEKKIKKVTLYRLSNGHTITKDKYEQLLEDWEESGTLLQPPIVLEKRKSYVETICRYRLCDTEVLDYIETDYKYLPLVFIDGNSVYLQHNESGATFQMTRPFVYHAKGLQEMLNFSFQTIGSEIENMVQHKFKVAVESVPNKYQEAYTNVQQADVLMYNAFHKENPQVPLPPPMEIQRTPTPPIVENMYNTGPRMLQNILGSYDSVLGIQGNQISGVAIQQGALQSNAAAIPYLMGFIKGMNRVSEIIIDLIPKYYVTPRSIPIKDIDGKRRYQIINDKDNPESISFNYNPSHLNVRVEPGINANIQKQVALDQIQRMMQGSEAFAAFINSMGLEVIIDNLDIRGSDALKKMAFDYMQQIRQQQEEAKGQPSPEQMAVQVQQEAVQSQTEVEMARIEQRRVEAEQNAAIKAAQVAIDKEKAEMQFIDILSKIDAEGRRFAQEADKIDTEQARNAVQLAIDVARHHGERNEKAQGSEIPG